jgi:pantoate--beta-alanine ligase
MITIQRLSELRATIRQQRSQGKRIGLVPTMGNLHEGHLSLVKYALEHADYVVSSVFVNPLQFGANEDLDKYPRTLQKDMQLLVEAGNHALFTPTTDQIYPRGLEHHTRVIVPELTRHHCGASRPGHFDGVSTVVNILFNMVQPHVSVFGEKDFQQLAVIRKMVSDLQLNIEIAGCPTVRDADGLAKSSRNGYLTTGERQIASMLYQTLTITAEKIRSGDRNFKDLQQQALAELTNNGFKPDYFNIANISTLADAQASDSEIVILAAAYLGNTRLIDNIRLPLI